MNRRELIKTSGGATLGFLLSSKLSLGPQKASMLKGEYTSLVKHGLPINDKKHMWSFMTVQESEGEIQKIENMFSELRYSSQLTYKSNDRFKEDISRSLIDYVLKSKNFSFEVRIIESDPDSFKHLSPSNLQNRMMDLYQDTLKDVSCSTLVLKSEDNFGPSKKFGENFEAKTKIKYQAVSAKQDRLIQVNDLISGILYYKLCDGKSSAKVKKKINKYFDELIKIPIFDYDRERHGPFQIKKIQLR